MSFEAHEKAQSMLVVTTISHYRASKLLQINTTLLSSLFWGKKLAWPEHIPCQPPVSASLSQAAFVPALLSLWGILTLILAHRDAPQYC